MASAKLSDLANLAGGQVSTDLAYVADLSAGAAGSKKSTLNDLFSIITKNITDAALRWAGVITASAPAVAPVDNGALYFNKTEQTFKFSENTGAYDDLVGAAKIQTLTNKTLNNAGLNTPTIVNPQMIGGFVSQPSTLADGATIATDAQDSNNFKVTLGGNRTLGNPTNAQDGQVIVWELIQDATGSRTLTYDTKFAFGTDITGATLSTAANKRDFLTVKYDLTADLFYVVAFVKGY